MDIAKKEGDTVFHFNEPMPDCVPEYYRARQEAADHEYELLTQRQEHYQANREKLDTAAASGLPVLPYGGYGPCWECQAADHDTMTDDGDDTCCVICRDPACPQHKNHQAKEGTQ